jgi:putative RecB family exonuclease
VLIRDLEDLSPLEKLSLIDMSHSRLDTYDMCPAKYFWSYVTKEPRGFAEHATMGNIVHAVLEQCDLEDLNQKEFNELFYEESVDRDPDGLISQELYDAGAIMLAEYIDRHKGEPVHTEHRELYFEGVIGNALFRGYIDRIDLKPDGSIHVIDYKSGKEKQAQKWAHKNLQLGLYALFAQKMWPDLWPIRGDLYYLKTGRMIGHTYTDEDLAWAYDEVQKRALEITNANNFGYTPNTRICSFCDYRKNGLCPGGKRYRGK